MIDFLFEDDEVLVWVYHQFSSKSVTTLTTIYKSGPTITSDISMYELNSIEKINSHTIQEKLIRIHYKVQ